MNIIEFQQKLDLQVINIGNPQREISGGYSCDLLSWVIGRTNANDAWVTIMTNVNTVAVALLSDVSCVILAENCELDENARQRAISENINIFRTPRNTFDISCQIGKLLGKI